MLVTFVLHFVPMSRIFFHWFAPSIILSAISDCIRYTLNWPLSLAGATQSLNDYQMLHLQGYCFESVLMYSSIPLYRVGLCDKPQTQNSISCFYYGRTADAVRSRDFYRAHGYQQRLNSNCFCKCVYSDHKHSNPQPCGIVYKPTEH